MFSNRWITKSTGTYSDNTRLQGSQSGSCNMIRLKEEINFADAILIGAGAGLSTSAGFTYSGERFEKNFADFCKKYGFTDMMFLQRNRIRHCWSL